MVEMRLKLLFTPCPGHPFSPELYLGKELCPPGRWGWGAGLFLGSPGVTEGYAECEQRPLELCSPDALIARVLVEQERHVN